MSKWSKSSESSDEAKRMPPRLLKDFLHSFSFKVFTVLMALVIIITSSFTLLLILSERRTALAGLRERGRILGMLLAHNSRTAVFSENEELLNDVIEGAFSQKEVVGVSIYDLEGRLLKEKQEPTNFQDESARWDQETTGRVLREIRHSAAPHYMEDQSQMTIWFPVLSQLAYDIGLSPLFEGKNTHRSDRLIGFVQLTLDKRPLNEQLGRGVLNSIVMGLVFLLICSIAAYLLGRRITRPLVRLTESVKAVERGEVVERVPVKSKDEIGRLASAFFNMLESLKSREAEKQKLEEQLRQAHKMEAVGTLAGGIAHDFNNILACIMGYTELAKAALPPESKVKADLEEVFKAGDRAKKLVKHILTFSRQDPEKRVPSQIGPICEESLELLRSSLPSTIEIKHDIEENLPDVMADTTQIHQVIMNLCTNAAHAMQEKGGVLSLRLSQVTIDAEAMRLSPGLYPGPYLKLTVCDSGCGMPPEVINRIFEPYFTTKEKGKGTGMGLAVVHGVIRAHRGMIKVQSEPGKGTVFDVYLPAIQKEQSLEVSEIQDDEAIPRGNETVLFVDDEQDIVQVSQRMLRELGYEVVARTSSIEALEVFRAHPDRFAVVITDLTMPNMTGDQLAQELLRIRPGTPIILCTGFSERISREQAKGIGIQRFLMKPLLLHELARVLREVLDAQGPGVRNEFRIP